MAVEWFEVDQNVLDLAEEIIIEHHPHLLDAKIGFVFRSEAQSLPGGKVVLGQAGKVSAKMRQFVDLDFTIWLAHDAWERISNVQKRALIDHELCHCRIDPDGKAQIIGHDIEEFNVILERYGLWNSSLQIAREPMAQAVQQSLPAFEVVRQGRLTALDAETAEAVAG